MVYNYRILITNAHFYLIFLTKILLYYALEIEFITCNFISVLRNEQKRCRGYASASIPVFPS